MGKERRGYARQADRRLILVERSTLAHHSGKQVDSEKYILFERQIHKYKHKHEQENIQTESQTQEGRDTGERKGSNTVMLTKTQPMI